mgnify:CR=1 FL=1
MSYSVVAKRYAKALFELGEEKSILDELADELTVVKSIFENDESLNKFYENPRVSREKKIELTRQVFKDLSQTTLNTLLLLVEKRRINLVSEVVQSFVDLKNEASGIAEADVYSVRELTEDEKKQIQTVFEKKLNINTLRLNNIVDPSILGGLKIHIGNKIFDGTVQTQLKRLEQNIVTANK